MRILMVQDLQLNAANPARLSVQSFHKWQNERMLKFEDLLDQAQQRQVAHICLLGSLFGENIVPEKMIDSFFEAIRKEDNLQVYAFTELDEYQLISYRKDIPVNFHLFNLDTMEKQIGDIHFVLNGETITISSGSMTKTILHKEDTFIIDEQIIPFFEPLGFDDTDQKEFGYLILDSNKNSYEIIQNQKYQYRMEQVNIIPEDTQEMILEKLNAVIKKVDRDTFLRITITGKTAFGITINVDGLKNRWINRAFFLEAFDNSVMDVNEEMFENDISLRSEFVRLALSDDSLSETERNQLISCGWNALGGEGMTKE